MNFISNFKLILILGITIFVSSFTLADENSIYDFSWLDLDKEIFVLQNRKFRKRGRFYMNLGGGLTVSGPFVDSKLLQFRKGIFVTENFGLEVLYTKSDGEENSTAKSLRNDGFGGAAPFRRIVEDYFGAMFMWSLFYSKINTFNKIIYFDWMFGLGYAKVKEKNNKDEFLFQNPAVLVYEEDHNAFIWDTAFKFFITNSFEIRLDLTVLHYRANKPHLTQNKKVWYSNWDTVLSLGYSF